jgi:DNA-binding MarR family transcriptional regulator
VKDSKEAFLTEKELIEPLSEFRYQLRRFMQFSEQAALQVHLHPQQHQLLLQVAGAPQGIQVTIAYAAERLGLRHNSVVELVNRSVSEGLLIRHKDSMDARFVLLEVTPKGRRILRSLSEYHARELNELAPQLIRALQHVQQLDLTSADKTKRGIA